MPVSEDAVGIFGHIDEFRVRLGGIEGYSVPRERLEGRIAATRLRLGFMVNGFGPSIDEVDKELDWGTVDGSSHTR